MVDETPVTSTVGMAARRCLSWEPWRSGWLLMPSYDGRVSGRAICPLCREVASSEAEMQGAVEGLDGSA